MWHAAAYFDESGDSDRAYAMAGFMGGQHDCVHLDLAWRERILEKWNLEYFKASELESGTGQFAQYRDNPQNLDAAFSQREKDLFRQIKTESIDLILDVGEYLVGFGVVLVLPDYYRISEECRALGKIVPAPYFFCSNLMLMESGVIMNEINQSAAPMNRGLVRPVFDSHEEYSGRAKAGFDDFCATNPLCSQYLLPPYYENDQQYLVLQAADNLAYECRRLLITTDFQTALPERRAMLRLKERVYKIYKLNYEGLKVIIETNQAALPTLQPEIQNARNLDKLKR